MLVDNHHRPKVLLNVRIHRLEPQPPIPSAHGPRICTLNNFKAGRLNVFAVIPSLNQPNLDLRRFPVLNDMDMTDPRGVRTSRVRLDDERIISAVISRSVAKFTFPLVRFTASHVSLSNVHHSLRQSESNS